MSNYGNRQRKLTDEQLSELGEARERGLTLSQLKAKADRMGVELTESAISWQMLRIGADLPQTKRRPTNLNRAPYYRGKVLVTPYTEAEDAVIRKMADEGKGPAEMSRALGRKYHSVLGRLMTLARIDERAEETSDV